MDIAVSMIKELQTKQKRIIMRVAESHPQFADNKEAPN